MHILRLSLLPSSVQDSLSPVPSQVPRDGCPTLPELFGLVWFRFVFSSTAEINTEWMWNQSSGPCISSGFLTKLFQKEFPWASRTSRNADYSFQSFLSPDYFSHKWEVYFLITHMMSGSQNCVVSFWSPISSRAQLRRPRERTELFGCFTRVTEGLFSALPLLLPDLLPSCDVSVLFSREESLEVSLFK